MSILRPLEKLIRKETSCLVLVVAVLLFCVESGWAGESETGKKPLWEAGLFNGAMSFPHYRGSNEQMFYLLPIPYFIYRGEFLKVDRDGLQGVVLKSDHLESSLSLSGSPPINDDTEARAGMEELDALFGFGPQLKYYLNHRQAENPLYVSGSVHAVSSVDIASGFATSFAGFQYRANLVYRNNTWLKTEGSFFGVNGGVYYGDSGLNGYFYDVEQQEARPNRPFYRASRGHAGHSVHSYLIYRLTDAVSLGVFGRWDNVRHATFRNSPLVKQADAFSGGVSLIWKIAKSKTMVDTY